MDSNNTSVDLPGSEGSTKRWLQNVSLQSKVGGAILLSLVACMAIVGAGLYYSISFFENKMLEWAEIRSRARAKVELDTALSLYENQAKAVSQQLQNLAASSDFAILAIGQTEGLGFDLKTWLASRKDEFTFICVLARSGEVLVGLRIEDDGVEQDEVKVVPIEGGKKVPQTPAIEAAWEKSHLYGTIALEPEVVDTLGLTGTADAGGEVTPHGLERCVLVHGAVVRAVVKDPLDPLREDHYLVLGGTVLNRSKRFVDRLQKVFYGTNVCPPGEPWNLGGATIYAGGLAIASSLRDQKRHRAVNLRVSEETRRRIIGASQMLGTGVQQGFFRRLAPLVDVMGRRVGILEVGVSKNWYLENMRAVAGSLRSYSLFATLASFVIGLMGALVLGYLLARAMTHPLRVLNHCTETMATGRLDVQVQVHGGDEVGLLADGFRRMAAYLLNLALQVKGASRQINTAFGQIRQSLKEHATTTSEQSTALSETTKLLEGLASSASHIDSRVSSVVKMANQTLTSARQGVELAEKTLSHMDEIQEANQEDLERISDLSEKLKQIDDFVILINRIADETRLISFNARLEASSARSSGANMRFGVVATEINNLADRVTAQANVIRQRVGEIQDSMAALVASREAGSSKVVAGVTVTRKVSESLARILEDSESVLSNSEDISGATEQQKEASDLALSVVRNVDGSVTRLAEQARETDDVVESLTELTETLSDNVSRFQTGS